MEIDIKELDRDFPYELGIDLKYIETLDKGSFGTVLHVFDNKLKMDMALKVIDKTGKKNSYINKMKEEISILRKLNHPNIVNFYGFIETNNQLMIKMEYIKYGTLKNWINNRENINEEEASTIIGRILSAIEYLHGKQICHRDIKPENIMISRKNDLNSIKIIDFGLSSQNFDQLENHNYCGTYIYMAPELIEKKLYFLSIDMWSIGVLMFILLNNGKHPFYVKGDNLKQISQKIKNGKIEFYDNISPMAKHLVKKLLEPNPSWRYTASQAIKHPWITRNKSDKPPVTFNELLTKTSNKKILKDLFNVCLFFNYICKKKNFKFINNENDKERSKLRDINNYDENFSPNEEENMFRVKLREKSKSISSRNRIILSQKLNLVLNHKHQKEIQGKKNKNIFSIIQKYQIKKINNDVKLNYQKSNFSTINSKNDIKRDIKFQMIDDRSLRKKSNITLSPIKKYTTKYHKVKSEISMNKKREENKNINYLYQTPKVNKIYSFLSCKKLTKFLPKINRPKKLNLFQRNSIDSLNNIDSNYLQIILPKLKTSTKKENYELSKISNVKKLRMLKN